MIALSFLLAVTGLAAMGLSQPQHHGWALHTQPTIGRMAWLRWGGLMLVMASLVPAMRGWGAACGAVGWTGLLSLAAFTLILGRTFLSQPPKRRR
jgi:hypothetical protein